jgi:hypothetical protein
MTRHNYARHSISLTSLAALATTLQPALAMISAGSIAFIQQSSLRENMQAFGEFDPGLNEALELLKDCRLVVEQQLTLLKAADGPIEINDFFGQDTSELRQADLIFSGSSFLLGDLDSSGFVYTYDTLRDIVDGHIADILSLQNFTAGDADHVKHAAKIGADATKSYTALWNMSIAVLETWRHQNNMGSIITAAGADMPSQAKRA